MSVLLAGESIMESPKVKIEFDQSDAVYAPGDNLTGSVLIQLNQATKCKALSIKIEGKCSVRWFVEKKRKNIMGRKETVLEDYNALETYFERTFYLIRNTDSESRKQLEAGENIYPFHFTLPQNIPCAFEHKFGSIVYFVTATFSKSPTNFFCRRNFQVITPYNLNRMSRAAIGIDDEEYQNFCCMCLYKLGSLHARVRTPASGFVPGQTIEVTVSFYNDSASVNVKKIKIALERILKFQAIRPNNVIKLERSIIAKDKKRGSFGDKNEVILFMKVPQVLPSNLIHCTLIEIQYRLKVKIITSGVHFNIEKSYPILIGTLPLLTNQPTVVPTVQVQRNPPIVPSAPSIDTVVPVQIANMSLNQSSSSQQDTSGNQSLPQVQIIPQEEYQPIGFLFTNSIHSQHFSSRQHEAPPPSYEECTSNSPNFVPVTTNCN